MRKTDTQTGDTQRTGTIRHTIDLTDATARDGMNPAIRQSRRAREAAQLRAFDAYRTSRRRERRHAAIDALADGAMATGGLAIVNATMNMELGLPGGFAGIALGTALVGIGAVIALVHRRRSGGDDPAAAAMAAALMPRTIVLDEEQSVVYLDEPEHANSAHSAA